MRRYLLAGSMLALLTVSAAAAANPHYVVEPTFTDNGTTVTAAGKIAGVGNQDVTFVLTASGSATVICTNPGGNVAPGQTQQVTTSGTTTITPTKNGNVVFSVTTQEPPQPTDATDAGCPNDKWTASIQDVDFSSATLEVFQGGQEITSLERSTTL